MLCMLRLCLKHAVFAATFVNPVLQPSLTLRYNLRQPCAATSVNPVCASWALRIASGGAVRVRVRVKAGIRVRVRVRVRA